PNRGQRRPSLPPAIHHREAHLTTTAATPFVLADAKEEPTPAPSPRTSTASIDHYNLCRHRSPLRKKRTTPYLLAIIFARPR
ncbi:hypothetical protein Dimus_016491, partial [Dionaea muscipula]